MTSLNNCFSDSNANASSTFKCAWERLLWFWPVFGFALSVYPDMKPISTPKERAATMEASNNKNWIHRLYPTYKGLSSF